MSLYERNSIQIVDKRPVVYASFPYEEENCTDYIYLENIKKVILTPLELKTWNIYERSKFINFSADYNEKDGIYATIKATYNNISLSEKIEIQTFIDCLASSVYENTEFQKKKEIVEIKNRLTENIKKELFIEKGILCDNYSYNFVGQVYDKDNNLIALINNFSTEADKDNRSLLNLFNVISYLSFKEMEIKSINIYTGKTLIVIKNFDIVKSNEGILKQYQIKHIDIDSEDNSEKSIIDSEENIDDKEQFFDKYEKYLTNKESIFKKVSDEDNINDLFSDFEL
jgi:hypothetical protein